MLNTFLVQPIYNSFVFILGLTPGGDLGIAIIILTLIVRIIFYPVFTSSIRTQMALQVVQPELEGLREKYKTDPKELVKRQSELFRAHRIKLPSLFGSVILQFVIFFTLWYVFSSLGLPAIRAELLYPFVAVPDLIREYFLGVLNLTENKSVILALLVAVTQYFVMKLSLQRIKPNTTNMSATQLQAHKLQQGMMLYLFPVAMAAAAYFPAGAIGLYLLVMNIISLGQEWIIRRKPL